MRRLQELRHEFVEFIPDTLESGVLYISIPYATTTHLCACGCGNEVVNPLAPHGWQMMFDGRSVSLTPSVGNWSFDCESHYWIRRDRVDWADAMERDQIDAGRARRRMDIDRDLSRTTHEAPRNLKSGWVQRLGAFFRRK
jgi:hypothetical protein